MNAETRARAFFGDGIEAPREGGSCRQESATITFLLHMHTRRLRVLKKEDGIVTKGTRACSQGLISDCVEGDAVIGLASSAGAVRCSLKDTGHLGYVLLTALLTFRHPSLSPMTEVRPNPDGG